MVKHQRVKVIGKNGNICVEHMKGAKSKGVIRSAGRVMQKIVKDYLDGVEKGYSNKTLNRFKLY